MRLEVIGVTSAVVETRPAALQLCKATINSPEFATLLAEALSFAPDDGRDPTAIRLVALSDGPNVLRAAAGRTDRGGNIDLTEATLQQLAAQVARRHLAPCGRRSEVAWAASCCSVYDSEYPPRGLANALGQRERGARFRACAIDVREGRLSQLLILHIAGLAAAGGGWPPRGG
jgi:hypothetical protein